MTVSYAPLVAAIRAKDAGAIRLQFEATANEDLAEAATFVGPERLKAAMETFPGRRNAPLADFMPLSGILAASPTGPVPAAAADATFQVLVAVARQGFRINTPDVRADLRLPNFAYYLVATTLGTLAARRRVAPLLSLSSDITSTLPTATSRPPAIVEADFAAVAQRNAIQVAAIKAVAEVESGGRTGFDESARPKILFEAHHFGRLSGHLFDRTHPHLSNNDPRASAAYYSWVQYNRMHEALLLAPDAALGAASWGKFQVMGYNHSGWPDVRSFVAAMYVSEGNHLKAFESYCIDNGLMGAVRRKDWKTFAEGYNGPKQKGYDTRIANAYRRHGGT